MIMLYKDFMKVGAVIDYSFVKWVRRLNSLNEFELNMPYSKKFFEIFSDGAVVHKSNTDESFFVENINVYNDMKNRRMMLVKGVGAEDILSRRVAVINSSANITTIIKSLITLHFINPESARKIPELKLGNTYLENDSIVNLNINERTEVLAIIERITKNDFIGFSVKMDTQQQKYVLSLFEGEDKSGIVYSQDYGNVISSSSYILGRGHKNTVYIGDTLVGSAVGIERREGAMVKPVQESTFSAATDYLKEKAVKKYVDVSIDNLNRQFEYLKDFDLGDKICFKDSSLRIETVSHITEVTEFYENGKVMLDIKLGFEP